jgi:catechol 2,3-dioxygenase-like lactoylglutathione lyase family enzyme
MLNILSSYSGYSVNNLEQAKQFYSQKLGLKLTDEAMGLNFELPGGGKLFIYEKPDHQPANFTILNFVVVDIDQAVDKLSHAGVVFEHYGNMPAPQDDKEILRGLSANQGPDIAWFKDPAGNILSVLQEK